MEDLARRLVEAATAEFQNCEHYFDEIDHEGGARGAVAIVLRELSEVLSNEAYEMASAGGESPRPVDYSEGHYVGWMRAVDKVARRYVALADEIERQP